MSSITEEEFAAKVAQTVKDSRDAAREALVIIDHAVLIQVDDNVQIENERQGTKVKDSILVEGSAEGTYFLPNHQSEQERLNLQRQIFLLSFNDKLALAPIAEKELKYVLDVGSGSGIWPVEFVTDATTTEQHPKTQVLGLDISPCAPPFIPPNCTFEVHDAETEWLFPQKFDYIHGRALMSCFHSPLSVIKSAFAALTPGGYLELQDCVAPWHSLDDTLVGTTLWKFHQMTIAAAASLGRDVTQVVRYKAFFEEAGFVDVKEVHYQWPLGKWAKGEKMKKAGEMFREDMESVMGVLAERLLVRGAGMEKGEADEMVEAVRRDCRDGRVHAYMPGIVVYGRKSE
ncbi:S-adenosyl-L-methionine-dependent methyltransferase [Cadophora sp. DSE1049]|nr:S-adenosyl-L-methionine-dependent methyltransferase [Cadophora sp. DSE1049]